MITEVTLDLPDQKTYLWPDWMWVTRKEALILDTIAKKVGGPFVELGCCDGRSTWFLAHHNPELDIVAVDWDGAPEVMDAAQKGENPSLPLGYLRNRGPYPKVKFLCCDSTRLQLELVQPKVIFIDGNHTFAGVQGDSENAFAYRAALNPEVTLLWHDYHDEGSGPNWVGVGRYLREVGKRLPLVRFQGTNIVMWDGSGKVPVQPHA
jgi:hypothetical protein